MSHDVFAALLDARLELLAINRIQPLEARVLALTEALAETQAQLATINPPPTHEEIVEDVKAEIIEDAEAAGVTVSEELEEVAEEIAEEVASDVEGDLPSEDASENAETIEERADEIEDALETVTEDVDPERAHPLARRVL